MTTIYFVSSTGAITTKRVEDKDVRSVLGPPGATKCFTQTEANRLASEKLKGSKKFDDNKRRDRERLCPPKDLGL